MATDPRVSPRRLAYGVLRAGVTLALAAWVLARLSPADLVATLAGVRVAWYAGAALVYLTSQLLSAVRWALLGHSVGFDRALADYVRFYLIGGFFNLFGPSTLGGDAVRTLYLGTGRRRGLAAATVVFDRAIGLTMLVALAATAALALGRELPRPLLAGAVMLGAGLPLGWLACPWLARRLPPGHRLRVQIEQTLAPFWRDRSLLGRTAGLSVGIHLLQMTAQYLLARAAGVPLPFRYCLVFHPLIALAASLPVSLGGFGLREGAYVYLLATIGIGAPAAVALSLLWFAAALATGLVGGVVFAAGGGELPLRRGVPARPG